MPVSRAKPRRSRKRLTPNNAASSANVTGTSGASFSPAPLSLLRELRGTLDASASGAAEGGGPASAMGPPPRQGPLGPRRSPVQEDGRRGSRAPGHAGRDARSPVDARPRHQLADDKGKVHIEHQPAARPASRGAVVHLARVHSGHVAGLASSQPIPFRERCAPAAMTPIPKPSCEWPGQAWSVSSIRPRRRAAWSDAGR